ncbi:anaerobic ribonucleoside-triphosphate reductase activating protein [Murdochiella massiliensis]|uniref:anaerobic ribonucleoside-triphosphate reductase activating protein n=1 Tax=Murdochiella massiliensis TaxID=1673723 RepID=UPI000833A44A|nr:anaerobic ribonucleoside-triphosphate reductase activating protein [Murdochiella massiliensis]
MIIHGLQKLSLLDFPGRTAATVFLGGCTMRCPYCHNAEIWEVNRPGIMEEEGLYTFLRSRTGFLQGVCFSGGEPLMRDDLAEVIRTVRAMGFAVKLDTNGLYPDRLKALLDEGLLDMVAMDIKNEPARYAETVGISHIAMRQISDSVDLLLGADIRAEFRTTVTKRFHDINSFKVIGEWLTGADFYALQPFRVSDFVPDVTLGTPSRETLENYASILRHTIRQVEIRG